jgi:hypothetical protein
VTHTRATAAAAAIRAGTGFLSTTDRKISVPAAFVNRASQLTPQTPVSEAIWIIGVRR